MATMLANRRGSPLWSAGGPGKLGTILVRAFARLPG